MRILEVKALKHKTMFILKMNVHTVALAERNVTSRLFSPLIANNRIYLSRE